MRKFYFVGTALFVLTFVVGVATNTLTKTDLTKDFQKGTPGLVSMSTLEFGPEGSLFIGDSQGGAIDAIDLGDKTRSDNEDELQISDVEGKIAALLGTRPEEVLIHDMAVNPISQNAYVAVSRGRTDWNTGWQLPNELADAKILLRITPQGDFEEVPLDNVRYARVELSNPVATDAPHKWKDGSKLRSDAITDVVYSDGKLFVAGLSNEEFASTMWRFSFPFGKEATYSTLEIFHGAHGEYETHAPIRTFVPYTVAGDPQLLASYLCTPLVTFSVAELTNGQHVKGRTVGEFGSGNYPLDMVLYQKSGKDFVLMANSALPLLIFDPADVAKQKTAITKEVEGYLAGVTYEPRSGAGIQQIDNFNAKYILALQRMPSGKLDLRSLRISWL